MSVNSTIYAQNFQPLNNKVFVTEFDRGMQRTGGGIILMDDDMKDHGIRPRWAKVHAVGPLVDDLTPGEWVLISHGRWSQRIRISDGAGTDLDIWQVEYPEAVLLVSDDDPRDHEVFAVKPGIAPNGHGQ